MRIAFYSQHVLGVGHLFRSLEIVRALAGHEVSFVTGGAEVDLDLPPHAERLQLPGLMMSEDFSRFIPVGSGAGMDPAMDMDVDMDTLLEQRKTMLMEHMETFRPHVFLVELFPFGRKKFGFELLPVLEAAREGRFGPCRTACSLRDILVEKKEQAKFEKRVLGVLNPLFDQLLVHADPNLVRLEETFPAARDITIPVNYTGYVTPRPDRQAGKELRRELQLDDLPLVVASAGGGSVGQELLHATLAASALLFPELPHRLAMFTGPYAPPEDALRLRTSAEDKDHITVRTFTNRFPAYLSAASLSVSLAGYNTTMNLLGAGVHGLVMPFDQNREQRMRAERLQERGALTVLDPAKLDPARLAGVMAERLGRCSSAHGVDLNGAANTARILEKNE